MPAHQFTRRAFIQKPSMAAAGAAASLPLLGHKAHGLQTAAPLPLSRVQFATGTQRRQLINDVLGPLKDEITKNAAGKNIIIKTIIKQSSMNETSTSEVSKTNMILLVLAWLFVGVPLVWGVGQTMIEAFALF